MVNIKQHFRKSKKGKVIEVQPHTRFKPITYEKPRNNISPTYIKLPPVDFDGKYETKILALNYARRQFKEMTPLEKQIIVNELKTISKVGNSFDLKTFLRISKKDKFYDVHYNQSKSTFNVFVSDNLMKKDSSFNWFHHKDISKEKLKNVLG